MDRSDFYAAALIGQLASLEILKWLLDKEILTQADAKEIMDAALLKLERYQGGAGSQSRRAFERARELFDDGVRSFSGTIDPEGQKSNRRRKP